MVVSMAEVIWIQDFSFKAHLKYTREAWDLTYNPKVSHCGTSLTFNLAISIYILGTQRLG